MKKFFKLFGALVVALLASTLVLLAACASSVAGKTYVFEDAEVSIDRELSEVEDAAVDLAAAMVKEGLSGATMSFSEDGKVTMKVGDGDVSTGITYTQDGSTVTFTGMGDELPATAQATGSTLVFEMSGEDLLGSGADEYASGIVVKITFKVQ